MSDLPRAAVRAAADGAMTYWLQATHEDDHLREWWESGDADEAAAELGVALLAAAVRDPEGEPCPNVEHGCPDLPCDFCEGHGKVFVLKMEEVQ